MKAFAHSVSSSLSIFTYSSNLNSDISYFMEPFSIPLAEAVGFSLRAPTERTAAIAFVVITCLFFNLLSQNEFLKCKSGISCFLMPHCLAQFWNIVEKNSSNLLNEPICLLDLISHNTSPQYHTYILLCFRHRGLFTTLKSVKFCTTIVLFKELYLSALPISGARQNIFIDTQYRRPIVCCICRDSWELPLWPEPLPSECLPLHHSPVLFNFQMLLRKINRWFLCTVVLSNVQIIWEWENNLLKVQDNLYTLLDIWFGFNFSLSHVPNWKILVMIDRGGTSKHFYFIKFSWMWNCDDSHHLLTKYSHLHLLYTHY